jgi:hypothetical protein
LLVRQPLIRVVRVEVQRYCRGRIGPAAAASGLAGSLEFEQPIVLVATFFALLVTGGWLFGWKPFPGPGAPFESEALVMAEVMVVMTLCRQPNYAESVPGGGHLPW